MFLYPNNTVHFHIELKGIKKDSYTPMKGDVSIWSGCDQFGAGGQGPNPNFAANLNIPVNIAFASLAGSQADSDDSTWKPGKDDDAGDDDLSMELDSLDQLSMVSNRSGRSKKAKTGPSSSSVAGSTSSRRSNISNAAFSGKGHGNKGRHGHSSIGSKNLKVTPPGSAEKPIHVSPIRAKRNRFNAESLETVHSSDEEAKKKED